MPAYTQVAVVAAAVPYGTSISAERLSLLAIQQAGKQLKVSTRDSKQKGRAFTHSPAVCVVHLRHAQGHLEADADFQQALCTCTLSPALVLCTCAVCRVTLLRLMLIFSEFCVPLPFPQHLVHDSCHSLAGPPC